VIRRKMNRRHMTGDHHGRTASRATLPVTATDEILGTHSLQDGVVAGPRERSHWREPKAARRTPG
jgi:hypothetical protein